VSALRVKGLYPARVLADYMRPRRPDAMQFPSAEWAEALRRGLNESPAFQEAAKAWEADILFLVRDPSSEALSPGVRLQLSQGVCLAAEFLRDARGVVAEFVFEGTPANWRRLLRRELDPVRPFVDGTFKVRGNLAKALRFTRAAKELVDTASAIPVSDGP
jgi:putative sterol carrier protein